MKNLIFVVLVAPFAIGCGGDNNNTVNNNTPDMAQPLTPGPDLAPACITSTPASNTDFLNACSSAASIDIEPFYPDKAPNGTLPPLQ